MRISDHATRSSVPRSARECQSIAEAVGDEFSIVISCRAKGCAHRVVTPARPLFALFNARGWATDWTSAKTHMKCRECGSKDNAMAATDDGLTADPAIGPQSEKEYRELVQKLRNR